MAAMDAPAPVPAPPPSPRPAGSQQQRDLHDETLECDLGVVVGLAVLGLIVLVILGCIAMIAAEFLFFKPSEASVTAFSILGVLFSPFILSWNCIMEQQRLRPGLWAWIKRKVAAGFLILSLFSFVFLSEKLGLFALLRMFH